MKGYLDFTTGTKPEEETAPQDKPKGAAKRKDAN
jgi:hypothetical protein